MPEQPVARVFEFDPEDEYRPEPEPEPIPPAWLDGSLRIGIHTSIAGSYLNALESARKLGCNALQVFSSSPRMWANPPRITEADGEAFRARRAAMGLGPLVIHANYLINLAAPQPMLRARSIQSFHDELVRGDRKPRTEGRVRRGRCAQRVTAGRLRNAAISLLMNAASAGFPPPPAVCPTRATRRWRWRAGATSRSSTRTTSGPPTTCA